MGSRGDQSIGSNIRIFTTKLYPLYITLNRRYLVCQFRWTGHWAYYWYRNILAQLTWRVSRHFGPRTLRTQDISALVPKSRKTLRHQFRTVRTYRH